MSAEAGEQGSDDGSDEPQYARKCLLRIFFHFLFDFMIKLIELVGRFAQNYKKINSKNYKNRRRAKPLIIFLFNFFIILRPIGRPYMA